MENRLLSHLCVVGKNQEGYLGCRGPPEVRGIPAPHQAPQPRVPVTGKEVLKTSGCENQQGLRLSETGGFWSPRKIILKGWFMDLLRLTESSSAKAAAQKAPEIYGESSIRARAGGWLSPRQKYWQRPLFL